MSVYETIGAYSTVEAALRAYKVPENPLPGRSAYHDALEAQHRDVVVIKVRFNDGLVAYRATSRKSRDELYKVGSCWCEPDTGRYTFTVTEHL